MSVPSSGKAVAKTQEKQSSQATASGSSKESPKTPVHSDEEDSRQLTVPRPSFTTVRDLLNQPTNATQASSEQDEPSEAEHVYVKVLGDQTTFHRFQIKATTKMARLMGAYSIYTGLPVDNFRLFYQGRLVDKDDTVDSLRVEWGDIIDARTASTASDTLPEPPQNSPWFSPIYNTWMQTRLSSVT